MNTIISNILLVFCHATRVIERTNTLHANYTFYSYYLRKNYILFSLDSILLKLALKICDHYNSKMESQQPFKYETVIGSSSILRNFNNQLFISEDTSSDQEEDYLGARDLK